LQGAYQTTESLLKIAKKKGIMPYLPKIMTECCFTSITRATASFLQEEIMKKDSVVQIFTTLKPPVPSETEFLDKRSEPHNRPVDYHG